MKKLVCALLAGVMCLSLAACSKNPEDLVFAVEAGSAGEAVALEKGYDVISVPTQADALMEVESGNSNAAIIDSLMAGAMVGEGTSYPDLKVRDDKLTEGELYGVGCRKGSDLASFINHFFAMSYEVGTLQELAEKYGVQNALVKQEPVEYKPADYYSDLAYIREKGSLIVGITEFAPMDYKDDNGEWIGFDADLAKQVAEQLDVEIEFVVIDWDRKLDELNSKNVDVLWNGMSMTPAILENMECSNAYCNNTQVVVIK